MMAQGSNQSHLCDSLYQTKQFFEFRDAVLSRHGAATNDLPYFRGLAAAIFNQPSKTARDLTTYLKHTTRTDSVSRLRNAFDVLGMSYFRLYQYADAGRTYRDAIRQLGDRLDTAQQLDFANSAHIGEILADAPRQQVVTTRIAQMLPSKTGKYQISVKINDMAVDSDLFFDTGANFSILDSTTAALCHVKLLIGSITVGSITGNASTAQIGVIDNLTMGPISVRNVVVLVFRDADLSFPAIHYHVTGAIGFPVIEALGAVTFTSTGHIEAGGGPAKTLSDARPNLALDGLFLVVEAAYANERFPLHYDTGSDATMFYPPFLRKFPQLLKNAETSSHKFSGAGGEIVDAKAYKLRALDLQLGGKTISFDSVKAVTEAVNESADLFYGNLGRDATKQFDAVTLDFANMSLRLK